MTKGNENGMGANAPLLSVQGLNVIAQSTRGIAHIVRDVDFDIARGEVFAVIGESGSGKSTVAMAVGNLLDNDVSVTGKLDLSGQSLGLMSARQRRAIMGKRIALVSQNALSGLNPSTSVGFQIAEVLMVHEGFSRAAAFDRARELLELVGIPAAKERLHHYPHEFSGGMRQRAMIAMGVALSPDLLIADEPTTALDATIKAQIIRLLAKLRDEMGTAIMLITHDMGIVARIADRMMVMYGGRAVEQGDVRQIFRSPSHPYTRALLEAIPRLDRPELAPRPIEGMPPSPFEHMAGCAFAARCPIATAECRDRAPMSALMSNDVRVICNTPLTAGLS